MKYKCTDFSITGLCHYTTANTECLYVHTYVLYLSFCMIYVCKYLGVFLCIKNLTISINVFNRKLNKFHQIVVDFFHLNDILIYYIYSRCITNSVVFFFFF